MKSRIIVCFGTLILGILANPNIIRAADAPHASKDFSALILKLETPESSSNAASELARDPDSIPALLEVLRSSPHEQSRLGAAVALARFRWAMNTLTDSASPVSAALIAGMADANERVRCESVLALASVRPVSATNLSTITGAIREKNIPISCSLGALARIGEFLKESDASLALQVASHLSDNSPAIKKQAAWALKQMGASAEPAIPALISALSDPDGDVKMSAWTALASHSTPEAVAAMREYTEKENKRWKNRSILTESLLGSFSFFNWVRIMGAILLFSVPAGLYFHRWPAATACAISVAIILRLPSLAARMLLGISAGSTLFDTAIGVLEVITGPGYYFAALVQYLAGPSLEFNVLFKLAILTSGIFWGVTVYLVLSWYGRHTGKEMASN
jgi:HEAT repeat protein